MERYTATDIEQVSVAFDAPDVGADEDDVDDDQGDYQPDASLEIEHGSGLIDKIDVGPDGAAVLHEMVQEDEFEINVALA